MDPAFSTGKKVVGVFILGLAILAFIGWVSYRSTVRLIQLGQDRNHAHLTFEQLQNLFSQLQDAETGQRGFIITGDELYLAPYVSAVGSVDESLQELREASTDSPRLLQQLPLLVPLVAQKLDQLKAAIETRRTRGFEAAISLVQTGQGKKTMDSIRRVMAEIKSDQAALVEERTQEMRSTAQRTTGVIISGSLLSLLVVGLATIVIFRDLARRRQVEEALRDSEHRLAGERDLLHTLMDNVPDHIYFKDAHSRFTRINLAQAHVLGIASPEVAVGKTDFDFFTEEHAREAFADEQEIMRTSKPLLGKVENSPRPDGFSVWVDTTKVPIFDGRGSVTGLFGISRDITERKRAEQLLHESEEKFRTLFESIDEGFCIIEVLFDENEKPIDYRFLEINPSFVKQTGIPNALGKRMREIAPLHEERWFEIYGKIALTGEPARFDNKAAQLQRWYDVYAFRIGKPEQKRVAILFNDITTRKKREEELQTLNRQLKLRSVELSAVNEELEAFSYSVSHDLRAPLRSIDGFSQALLEDYQDKLDESGKDFLHRVRAATQRMAQLIDDLIELSRVTRAEVRSEAVSLSDIARTLEGELRASEPDRQVEFSIAQNLVAQGDERLLRVAVENLIRNAWKFTSKRSAASIELGTEGRENGKAIFFVRDNGAGFDMGHAQKLFSPFQRLHSMAEFKGTGVGLATVQRIIHRHGGRVWAEGRVDQGACFYFTL